MSENQKTNVDANTREFRRGVEAGIKSEDTNYWQAGYELGQALSDQETKEADKEAIQPKSDTPLSSWILWMVKRVTPSTRRMRARNSLSSYYQNLVQIAKKDIKLTQSHSVEEAEPRHLIKHSKHIGIECGSI